MPKQTWKIVWSNGDERYVEANSRPTAAARARLAHGPTSATIIYCAPYA